MDLTLRNEKKDHEVSSDMQFYGKVGLSTEYVNIDTRFFIELMIQELDDENEICIDNMVSHHSAMGSW